MGGALRRHDVSADTIPTPPTGTPGAGASFGGVFRANPALDLRVAAERQEQVDDWLRQFGLDAGLSGMEALVERYRATTPPPASPAGADDAGDEVLGAEHGSNIYRRATRPLTPRPMAITGYGIREGSGQGFPHTGGYIRRLPGPQRLMTASLLVHNSRAASAAFPPPSTAPFPSTACRAPTLRRAPVRRLSGSELSERASCRLGAAHDLLSQPVCP